MTGSAVKNELVVISGASSGIGAASAREFASRGSYVLAGVRRQVDADAIRTKRIEPIPLDVTSDEHVEALASRVADDPQGRVLRARAAIVAPSRRRRERGA
nr:SDR family NAD(P)-dependent oxidoreductase [Saccharomonospora piscinae]